MYSVAITYDSMGIAMIGRILCGFGSAEVVNRQLISACVSYQTMTKASALFVSVSAAGMSVGPLIASILDIFAGRDEHIDLQVHLPGSPEGSGLVLNHVTAPGFLMALTWGLQLVAVVLLFEEPQRINAKNDGEKSKEVATYGSLEDQKTTYHTGKSVLHDIATSLIVIFTNMAFPVSFDLVYFNKH